ncbi:MAG: vitamin K epoxide reductase family protein [Phycisphaerales bacterium]
MELASSNRVKVVTILLAAVAAGLSGLLLYQSQTLDLLPGCGGGSGCETVLGSKWSVWFGIPVSLPALGIYTAMFAAVLMRDPESRRAQPPIEWVMVLCAVAAIAAALWFVTVQVALVGALCKYCLATHTVGVAAAVLCILTVKPLVAMKSLATAGAAALALAVVLIGGQVVGNAPESAGPRVTFAEDEPMQVSLDEPLPTKINDPLAMKPPAVVDPLPKDPAPKSPDIFAPSEPAAAPVATSGPRKVKLYGGRFEIDTTAVPVIGDPYAPIVLAVLYDYTCIHCRHTREMLEKTKEKYGDKLVIVCLPTPLDSRCNKMVRRTGSANRYACELAKTSLALWKAAPGKWAGFDHRLYTEEDIRTTARATIAAWELVGESALDKAMKEGFVDDQIAFDVKLYALCGKAAGTSMLPMLVTEHGIMTGAPKHPLDIDDLIAGKRGQ